MHEFSACGGQKMMSERELEFHAVVSCPVWDLGSKLGSSRRLVSTLLAAEPSL